MLVSEWVPSTCMRCAVGCGFAQRAAEDESGLAAVTGDVDHPVTAGLACSRGIEETRNPDGERLLEPLVRTESGALEATTWDEALARAIEGFRDAHERPDGRVAVLGSGQQTTEAAYALGKVARGGFGTELYDANTTLCMASAVTAYYQAFGSDAPPCTYDDVGDAQRHVVWGANPAVAHPVLFRWLSTAANADGVELVVVDPVRTATAEQADRHVAPDPGMDLALARAVLARLVETDRVDHAFVDAATDGFAELVDVLPAVADAAADAGVAATDVETLADAVDHRALVYWGMGVNQHVQGTEIARALIDLTLATGNLRPGGGPFSLTGQANSMGARMGSSKGTWPGHRPFRAPGARRAVADAWGVPVERLPDDAGPGPVGVFEATPDAVWTVATNPAAGMPDADVVRDGLADAFVVAQDAFVTETTALADVVLPAATWGESEGTATNMERSISRVRAATDPPAGARRDLETIATVGSRLFPGLFASPDPDTEAVFDEFAALTAGTPADCSGVTYDRLDEALAVRWPAPDEESAGGYRYHDAAAARDEAATPGDANDPDAHDPDANDPDAHAPDANDPEASTPGAGDESAGASWSFPTASGNAQFSTGQQAPLPEPAGDGYPLTLTTAREPAAYNTGVRSRGGDAGELVARIHPRTAAAHADAFRDGRIVVASRRGSAVATVARDAAVPDGVVWVPIHHPATNRLTLSAVDPQSKEPHFKQCAVRLEQPD